MLRRTLDTVALVSVIGRAVAVEAASGAVTGAAAFFDIVNRLHVLDVGMFTGGRAAQDGLRFRCTGLRNAMAIFGRDLHNVHLLLVCQSKHNIDLRMSFEGRSREELGKTYLLQREAFAFREQPPDNRQNDGKIENREKGCQCLAEVFFSKISAQNRHFMSDLFAYRMCMLLCSRTSVL